jgi:hypothetical protein
MVETIGAAHLTDSIAADRAVGTTVARRELAAVLEAGGRPELVLDLVLPESDERSTVAIEWLPDDIRTLLEETEGDVVTLTFDRDELGGVFDDVEAHGLRMRAAIITVAAAGALGSAATLANAMPTLADTSGAAVGSGGGAAPVLVTDAASGGGYGTVVSDSAAGTMASDAATGGGYAAPAETASTGGSTVTDASTGGGYGIVVSDSAAGTMVSDAALSGGYGSGASSGGETFGVPTPSPTDAILIGGAVLAIAGAAFVARRPGTAKPA